VTSDQPHDGAFRPSRFIIRLLDRSEHVLYGAAFAVGAWPILLAYLIGAHCTDGAHIGYWDSPNWWSLAILLPALVFAFRFIMAGIVPVGPTWPPATLPPIIDLVREESARKAVYGALRQCVLSRWNVAVPFAVTGIVHLLDAPNVLAPYTMADDTDPSWMSVFEVNPEISEYENLMLLISAEIAQFSAVFLGILTIVLLFRHNLFFVRNVYQRRWVPAGKGSHFFQINPKDVNRCFGFRIANVAFNAQVQALMIAGAAMFLSRYASVIHSVGADPESWHWPRKWSEITDLFPLPSQWLMALFWLVALAVVSMPALVKLLPRLPGLGAKRVELSIGNYLHEFFSDESWPKDKTGRDEPLQIVAGRFAQNSFWPTGDNRAGVLFFFAYWIFFVTLVPAPVNHPVAVVASLAFFAALAYLTQLATFAALKLSLRYVDDLLVTAGTGPGQELDRTDPQSDRSRGIGVFISYRRRDSAGYARSIQERLLGEFRPERVFMDLSDIAPGENFVQRIDRVLGTVDAVIVLIGDRWLTEADDQGRRRILDPADMVHIEVATALRLGKHVLPVLVHGAKMPGSHELPAPLKALARLNAVELSDTRWAYDVGRLIDALRAR
jgi:hypothetical protein